jgi:hypothetical protein
MVKKRSEKKMVKEESCDMHKHCSCCWISMKLAVIAFVLFLLTVWPWLNRVLLSVHWGIYLAIAIVVLLLPMCCPCKKK